MLEEKVVFSVSFLILSAICYLWYKVRNGEKSRQNKYTLTEGTMNKGGRNEYPSTHRPTKRPGCIGAKVDTTEEILINTYTVVCKCGIPFRTVNSIENKWCSTCKVFRGKEEEYTRRKRFEEFMNNRKDQK